MLLWTKFTYVRKETRIITRLFKNTNARIAYKTKNTIQNYLQLKKQNTDKYNKSGMYQMKFNECQLRYIEQTGRNFRTRNKEHIKAIRSNRPNSKYSQHILDTQHTYGTIVDTIDILHFEKKGPLMKTSERFHIYNLSKENLERHIYRHTQPHL
jgi:hypothetical protein